MRQQAVEAVVDDIGVRTTQIILLLWINPTSVHF